MSTNPVRAAVYLRISQDREMDGLAIERQREDCLEIVERNGWQLAGEYVDQSKSATDKTKKRPAYDRMVADYEAGRFSAIVCYDLDRLTRQPRQLEDWIDAAEEQRLSLVTVSGEADLASDSGRFFVRVKAAAARGEVERKSERQSRAHLQRAKQGRPPKGVRPLGYNIDGSLVPAEAEAAREIFRLFAIHDGPSIAAIAAGLSGKTGPHIPRSLPHLPKHSRTLAIERNERRAAEGLDPKPVPDDGPWSSSTVLGILRNPRYAGYSVYTDRRAREDNKRRSWHAQIVRGSDGEPVRGLWDPIVDDATWWRVQQRLDAPERITNRKGSTARLHLGSGLYQCGECHVPVRAHGQRYRCPECHLARSRAQIDDWVLRIIRARLGRPDLVDALEPIDQPRITEIAAQIAAHEARIIRAQRDYDQAVIEGFDLKRIRDRERAEIDELTKERLSLMMMRDLGGVVDAVDPVAAFDEADLMIKRRIIDLFCTVFLYRHQRGKKTFNPETVRIVPKGL
ncbi:recombinase family protein [Helcobacillus massiliensis]|uniref:DNA invertase Pin-like site-specific DNA recombinase n=1 Tax=Helcobacillus massiliensis TaxID=521392 RepID=A0A839QVH3_9MICO|nr:recombinase family protein [Helcobacillus massiliensis]MBB3022849.1 DNA invertase Pin-like site-specific DNA recombinase [Helcobacillus massiliensis]